MMKYFFNIRINLRQNKIFYCNKKKRRSFPFVPIFTTDEIKEKGRRHMNTNTSLCNFDIHV